MKVCHIALHMHIFSLSSLDLHMWHTLTLVFKWYTSGVHVRGCLMSEAAVGDNKVALGLEK